MNDSEILIVGANGQLGKALQVKYPRAVAVDMDQLDISDRQAVDSFKWDGIRIILNAAAYTNVDGAETPEGRVTAWAANAVAPANLARVARQNGITLLHISTDYVFDGTKEPHAEDEPFSPLSVYGASKAAGDIAVAMAPKHYILRTSWVIGEGKNFVRTMLELGNRNISPKVVSDQVGRLTFTSELVRAIDHLFSNNVRSGTYNISNGGEVASWADITRKIFEFAGYPKLTVTDISTADYYKDKPEAAPRPLKSALDLGKIEATGFVATDWMEDLKEYVDKNKLN